MLMINQNLVKFCNAIRDYEGAPGDLNYRNNNPGNCRCSPLGYLPQYGDVQCVNGFAVFPTMELGEEYLQNLVYHRVLAHPDWSFLDFFQVYAPSGDDNDPEAYADNVAVKCDTTASTILNAFFAAAVTS